VTSLQHAGLTSGYAPRQYEFEEKRAYVADQPTVAEKLVAVTPYRREWTDFERKRRKSVD